MLAWVAGASAYLFVFGNAFAEIYEGKLLSRFTQLFPSPYPYGSLALVASAAFVGVCLGRSAAFKALVGTAVGVVPFGLVTIGAVYFPIFQAGTSATQ
ncbi:MAG: hypothetical protein VX766_10340 [Pseudomonadota bacterium]|nr:hypothetical protein [Pseudomonadota bacterium]